MTLPFLGPILIALLLGAAVAQSYSANSQDKGTPFRSADRGNPGTGGSAAFAGVTLRSIKILSHRDETAVEITAARPITPTLTVLTSPDRLVLDFSDTLSAIRHSVLAVNHGGVRSVRIGFQPGDPPTTRVVVDLLQSRNYELVPGYDKIVLKLRPVGDAGEKTVVASAMAVVSASDPPSSQSILGASEPDLVEVALKTKSSSQWAEWSPGVWESANPPGPTQDSARNTQAPEGSGTTASSGQEVSQQTPGAGGQPTSNNGDNPAPATNGSSGTVSGPAAGGDVKPAPNNQPPDVPGSGVTPKKLETQPSSDEYVIGEQDVLTITVWRERELSGLVVVRPDGKITLPLVDEIKVVGLTPGQLRVLLVEKLKPFVTVPQVTVAVSQINSRKVYLIGEAAKTGTFAINSSTTILQLLAEAGGVKDFAKRKDIYVLRNQQGKQVRFRFNYDQVVRGKNSQQNILLEPGDTIIVP